MGVTCFSIASAYHRETLLPQDRWITVMYSRTQNENGTYNTRCLDCLLTIATSVETETDLEQLEMRHLCPEKVLAQLLAGKSVPEAAAKGH